MNDSFELILKPSSGWQPINLREIWLYRELFAFLIWRDIKIRYRQTALGALWAILQPLLAMLIFTVFFNRIGGVAKDIAVPYPLFSFCGVLAWTFFANSITASSNSLIGNRQLIAKIYFPRIFIPLGAIGALVVDLFWSIAIAICLLIYYKWGFFSQILLLPVFIFVTFIAASGVGLFFSGLNVQFRDVKYVVPFFVQMGLFVTPVIYPLEYIPERYRLLLGLNPMAGMVDGFRYSLLGTPAHWNVILLSTTVSIVIFVSGLFVFKRLERRFADII